MSRGLCQPAWCCVAAVRLHTYMLPLLSSRSCKFCHSSHQRLWFAAVCSLSAVQPKQMPTCASIWQVRKESCQAPLLQIEGGNKMLILAVLPKVINVLASLHCTKSAPSLRAPCWFISYNAQQVTPLTCCMYCLTGTVAPAALPLALQGGPAAKNPQYLHCVEHALGLGDWAKQHGATLIATDDKDRSNSGKHLDRPGYTMISTPPTMSEHAECIYGMFELKSG